MNIVLVGFMGTGKTKVGKELAKRLNRRLVNIDSLIEEEMGMEISQIFSELGEPYFRKLEKMMAVKVSQEDNQVIDTGGGIVLNQDNIANLKRKGMVICLTATPEVILRRTRKETHRPLLEIKYPEQTIRELLKYRAPFYAQADYSIDTSNLSVDEVVEKIIEIMRKKE